MTKEIRVRYLSDKVSKLEYIGGKSDWIDLRAAEDVELKTGEFKLIPLGVAMQLPTGYEAHMIPRSSTYKNFGIIQANHMGLFDASYCGDNDQWYFPAIAMRDTVIHAGERICQFRMDAAAPKKIVCDNVYTKGQMLCIRQGDYIYKYPLIHIFSVCHKHGCHIGSREHQKKNGLIPNQGE